MGTITKRGDKYQLRIKNKLLPKGAWFVTVDSVSEAETLRDRAEAMLALGQVPVELLAEAPKTAFDPSMAEILRSYEKHAPITRSDMRLMPTVTADVAHLRYSGVTFAWAEAWVRDMKVRLNIVPSTIRQRVGLVARVLDWHINHNTPHGEAPRANPLRMLPRGYSAYNANDLKAGATARVDQVRNRRLAPEEEKKILAALTGVKDPKKERALPADPYLHLMFDLIVDTGLRQLEALRVRLCDIKLAERQLYVHGTKGHRRQPKPRYVPLKPALVKRLEPYVKGKEHLHDRLLPYWDGIEDEWLASQRMSARFKSLFDYAGLVDFHQHDLRHEATCRWVTLRNKQGHWVFSDLEVCKIMGWSDTKMMMRYASLRGTDLADRLL